MKNHWPADDYFAEQREHESKARQALIAEHGRKRKREPNRGEDRN